MGTEFQVTFDSADPAAHAAFFAEAVHYVQAPPPAGLDSWDAALDAWGVPAGHRNDRAALIDPRRSRAAAVLPESAGGQVIGTKNRLDVAVRSHSSGNVTQRH